MFRRFYIKIMAISEELTLVFGVLIKFVLGTQKFDGLFSIDLNVNQIYERDQQLLPQMKRNVGSKAAS